MKKILISLLYIFTITFQSCFEDKGNYDYAQLGEITIEGIEGSYTVTSMIDVLKINPIVTSTMEGEEDDYEYMWGIHTVGTGSSNDVDTISRDKNLNELITADPSIYRLVFCVKNTKYNLIKYKSVDFNVVTSYSDGWYILKDKENKTDLNLHLSDNSMIEDLLLKTRGYSLEGEASRLGFFPIFSWNVYGPTIIKNVNKKVFIPMSKKEAAMYEVNTMRQLFDYQNMFYGGTTAAPKFTIYNQSTYTRAFVTTEGYYAISSNYPVGTGKYDAPILLDGKNEVRVSPITAGGGSVILFDEAASRFLRWNYSHQFVIFSSKQLDGTEGIMSPNNMNSDIICMRSPSPINPSATTYALMRKKDATKEMYTLTLATGSDRSDNPIKEVKYIDKTLNVNNATLFGFNFDVPFIYFMNGSNLCYYNCESNSETLNIKSFGSENVVFIKHIIYKRSTDIENSFNHLVVGVQNGDRYKLYLFNTLAGVPDGEAVRILEGEGRAVDTQFIASKMNGNGDYTLL